MKSGLGRITENTPKYQGVVVYSMADLPIGFGVAAKATSECRHADPMNIIAFHQVSCSAECSVCSACSVLSIVLVVCSV